MSVRICYVMVFVGVEGVDLHAGDQGDRLVAHDFLPESFPIPNQITNVRYMCLAANV